MDNRAQIVNGFVFSRNTGPWLAGLACVLASLWLSACAGVLESNKPAREVYLLSPPGSSPSPVKPGAPRLVMSLDTVPGLDTDEIQVLGSNSRLNPVANAHWPDNLPEVMSSLSRRTLIDSGKFAHVAAASLARPGEWSLELELQAFYGLQDSGGVTRSVLFQMEAGIRCDARSDVIHLESKQNVRSASLADLVSAHQQAVNEALPKLPAHIEQACSQE
jgi:ABC-type uncharacterized transport system auxiliary subunit